MLRIDRNLMHPNDINLIPINRKKSSSKASRDSIVQQAVTNAKLWESRLEIAEKSRKGLK